MRETLYIRFDWAIKRLLRHKADFVVVEGFLSSLLGYSVTITDVLESESNRDAADDKANCVDVLVKDEKGVKILIEIQNEFERDFFQRMLYGTSKLVTQYLTRGGEYGQIGKIYSVNIVYFSLGDGQDYVYRGRTDFRGIHTHDTLKLSARQRAVFLGEEAGDVFPEYFVLRVNDFDQAAVTPLDEWIRFLKTEEIPEGSKAPGLAEARERLI
ncbi:MAG: Rpn family recombination-promoting nuclease/putative transposase, partial [Verrucomicrobiota bacterium]|nr:Rpn family recombination-promoting nuclease/putative transposase [Verrucomicrobiota bacterium]